MGCVVLGVKSTQNVNGENFEYLMLEYDIPCDVFLPIFATVGCIVSEGDTFPLSIVLT